LEEVARRREEDPEYAAGHDWRGAPLSGGRARNHWAWTAPISLLTEEEKAIRFEGTLQRQEYRRDLGALIDEAWEKEQQRVKDRLLKCADSSKVVALTKEEVAARVRANFEKRQAANEARRIKRAEDKAAQEKKRLAKLAAK
jgi:hypothetical protein